MKKQNKQIIKNISLLALCLLLTFCAKPKEKVQEKEDFKLQYTKPAIKWTEALPIGNGSLGAMIYGGVNQEHIQFNEETLWRGEPHNYANEDAGKYLGEIRELLATGKQLEAQKLAQDNFMSDPIKQIHYQPFGDIFIDFKNHENFSNYKRELNLNNAINTVSYTIDDVDYKREVLSSFPDQIIAINLTSSKDKALSFDLWLDAIHEDKSIMTSNDSQTLVVKVKDGVLRGISTLKVKTNGNITHANGKLQITEASNATIYLTAATNYIDFEDVSGQPEKIVPETLSKVQHLNYETVKSNHISDYQSLYNRFQISFGDNGKSANTTDQRIRDFSENPSDPQLVALYVAYARYLTITSSRPGTKAATLQGIWNDKLTPPWFSSYTTNINLEMNYWPVEMYNLSECHEPLFDLIEDLSVTGAKVAKAHYNADGWIVHHNVDIWRGAAPVNASHHGIWLGGAAWLSTHIWEHYLFTQDKDFLEKRYALMRNAALFYSQFLYEDPNTGYLISSPSNSPEIGGLVAGPTMDHQLIRALFRNTIEASQILNTDLDFTSTLKPLIHKIAPNKIGKHGQLQEWLQDKDNPESHHRHVSHLWAVHPGNEINYEDTPDLMKAAKQSLEYRGDNGTGWSLAWKINFWSRFRDGDHAYKLVHKLLSPAERPNGKEGGGSYANLFDAHPPFQIDGNFGGASGILEMILQSQLGKIELLPALPSALAQGSVSGIVARGGFELSFSWEEGTLKEVSILSKSGSPCILKYNDKIMEFQTEAGKTYSFDGALNKK